MTASFSSSLLSRVPIRGRLLGLFLGVLGFSAAVLAQPRSPGEGRVRKGWLENMIVHHGFNLDELRAATGLSDAELASERARFPPVIELPARAPGESLKVLPYPGGRHPRLGFLDGAINPQRETKLSIFTPWNLRDYVVVDLPEAIWSNLGLTYLAHTHIDTIWDRQKVQLPPGEWSLRGDGSFTSERWLPNGVSFGVRATPATDHVAFRWWMRNGTTNPLTQIRAQVCVLLGRATGFSAQTGTNKVLESPFAAARDETGRRWVITAWDALDRVWQNPPVPCLHADPKLADCPPGAVQEARGWLWFYEGDDIRRELQRLRRQFLAPASVAAPPPRRPIPDRLVVLTLDDSSASHHAVVRPLLKRLGFGATFFITEGFSFRTNKRDYLTWEQIADLHRDGFEIGNHTRDHLGIIEPTVPRLAEQLEAIRSRCLEYGIPAPVSFAWPGNAFHPAALPILKAAGIRFARRGGEPEVPYSQGGGQAYESGADHPLLIPTAGDARPTWSLADLQRAVTQARDGRIAVLQFHGAPDGEHPWVNTPPERFTEYMEWLHREHYQVIALRDLARHVDPDDSPADPLEAINHRLRRRP